MENDKQIILYQELPPGNYVIKPCDVSSLTVTEDSLIVEMIYRVVSGETGIRGKRLKVVINQPVGNKVESKPINNYSINTEVK